MREHVRTWYYNICASQKKVLKEEMWKKNNRPLCGSRAALCYVPISTTFSPVTTYRGYAVVAATYDQTAEKYHMKCLFDIIIL